MLSVIINYFTMFTKLFSSYWKVSSSNGWFANEPVPGFESQNWAMPKEPVPWKELEFPSLVSSYRKVTQMMKQWISLTLTCVANVDLKGKRPKDWALRHTLGNMQGVPKVCHWAQSSGQGEPAVKEPIIPIFVKGRDVVICCIAMKIHTRVHCNRHYSDKMLKIWFFC